MLGLSTPTSSPGGTADVRDTATSAVSELKKQGKRADLVAAVTGPNGKGKNSDDSNSSSSSAGKRGSVTAGTSRTGAGKKICKSSAGGGRNPSADSNKNSKGEVKKEVAPGGNASSRTSSGSSKSVHDVGDGRGGRGDGGVAIQGGGAGEGVGSEGARGGESVKAIRERNAMTDRQQQRAVMSDGSRGEETTVKGPGGVGAKEATEAGSMAKKGTSNGEF